VPILSDTLCLILGFTYIFVVYAAMTVVCCSWLLTHWVVTGCPILAASALYCAATVRLVAVPYKLHWSYDRLADNLQLRRVGDCVRLTRVRNHARSIRVTLVTNTLPPVDGFVNKSEGRHYLSIVDMLLVPCTDLVFQFACAEESTRLPQGLHLLYPNPNITYFVEEINCGYVVRLVLFGANYDIQLVVWFNFILSPFSYWTTGMSWFFGI